MKNLMLTMVVLLSVSQAKAESFYRPYASCLSTNHKTTIEIMQNTDVSDVTHPFSFSIDRSVNGNKVSMMNQTAITVPGLMKNELEAFRSSGEKSKYAFELTITKASPLNMTGEFKSKFTDFLGSSVIYCSYHITFGN